MRRASWRNWNARSHPGLEREDGTCFFTNIVPLAGGNASEGAGRARVAVSSVERLLEGEGRPTIELVVERANRHGAVAILQGCLLEIAALGLIDAVESIDRPAGVATRGVGVRGGRAECRAERSRPASGLAVAERARAFCQWEWSCPGRCWAGRAGRRRPRRSRLPCCRGPWCRCSRTAAVLRSRRRDPSRCRTCRRG